MACRLCGSDKQTKFGTEINIHIPGMKNLDKPPVLVFPKLLVCLSCGFAECTFPENELLHLTKASTASWSERSLSATPANPLDQLSRAKFLSIKENRWVTAMQVPATERRDVRFGSFEVDLTSCELRKDGRKVKLQEKPFHILAILLEQPGEMVTREEFRQKLWPSDTFVDFEHGINTAVKKLREALEDHAEEPRYIETLPRHGYRIARATISRSPRR